MKKLSILLFVLSLSTSIFGRSNSQSSFMRMDWGWDILDIDVSDKFKDVKNIKDKKFRVTILYEIENKNDYPIDYMFMDAEYRFDYFTNQVNNLKKNIATFNFFENNKTNKLILRLQYNNQNGKAEILSCKYIDVKVEELSDVDYNDHSGKKFDYKEEDSFTAVSKMGLGMNLFRFDCFSFDDSELGNATTNYPDRSVAEWEGMWDNFPDLTIEQVKNLKSQGIKSVRLIVTWFNHTGNTDVIKKDWMDRIYEVVGWLLDEDMYVILDFHADSGSGWSDEEIWDPELKNYIKLCDKFPSNPAWIFANEDSWNTYHKKYEKMLRQIAETFKNYNEKLIFESPNELLCHKYGEVTENENELEYRRRWIQLFIDTVRSTGGNNETRNLAISVMWEALNPVRFDLIDPLNEENHFIYDVHFYSPYEFTHAHYHQNSKRMTSKDIKVNKIIKDFKNKFYNKVSPKYPIIIGEIGVEASLDLISDEECANYAKLFYKEFKKLGIPLYIYNWENHFGIINHSENIYPKYYQAIKEIFPD